MRFRFHCEHDLKIDSNIDVVFNWAVLSPPHLRGVFDFFCRLWAGCEPGQFARKYLRENRLIGNDMC
jgi:hypothetical protein